jgi:hypothetical protein
MSTWDETEFDYIWEELLNESKYNYQEYDRPVLRLPVDYYDYYDHTDSEKVDEDEKRGVVHIVY